MFSNKALTGAAIGTLAAAGAIPAFGEVVYQFTSPEDRIRQQAGNNYYYYGDDATLAPTDPRALQSITLRFGLFSYDSQVVGNYTPSIRLDVFEIDAVTRVPVSNTPIATSVVDDVTFQPSQSPTFFDYFTSGVIQDVTFLFSGEVLPDHIAFAYHDQSAELNLVVPGDLRWNQFASSASTGAVPDIGTTVHGHLAAYPNSLPPNWYFGPNDPQGFAVDRQLLATIVATPVPEPSTLAVLAGSGLMLLRRRRV